MEERESSQCSERQVKVRTSAWRAFSKLVVLKRPVPQSYGASRLTHLPSSHPRAALRELGRLRLAFGPKNGTDRAQNIPLRVLFELLCKANRWG